MNNYQKFKKFPNKLEESDPRQNLNNEGGLSFGHGFDSWIFLGNFLDFC